MQHTSSAALVTNNAAAVESLLQSFTSNASTKLVRNDKMAGRDYVVVPMVMIVEGVLNGSKGALLYTADEMRKPSVVANWNMKPVVVNHPEKNGNAVSACDPDILTKYQVGVIMNTRFEAGSVKAKRPARLVAEAWIDVAQANNVDARVMEAVEKKKTLELSTGLFTENEAADGEFMGKKYDAIARNFKADHLAILPDKAGACSIDDGAGFIRNELAPLPLGTDMVETATRHILTLLGVDPVTNALSFSAIQQQLYSIMRAKLPATAGMDCCCDCWIEEVFDGAFIYSYQGKLFGQKYSKTETSVELDGSPEEVVRATQYKQVTTGATFVGNLQTNQNIMNKVEMIAFLLANATSGFTANAKNFLEGCDDATLKVFVENTKKTTPPEKKETPAANAAVVAPAAAAPATNGGEAVVAKPLTAAEYIANAPLEVRELLQNGLDITNAEKDRLITVITANKGNKFTKEHLATLNLGTLQGMAALCANAETVAPARPPMFQGLGSVTANGGAAPVINGGATEEVLSLPVMNFKKEETAAVR